jgi:hypothetical protein
MIDREHVGWVERERNPSHFTRGADRPHSSFRRLARLGVYPADSVGYVGADGAKIDER